MAEEYGDSYGEKFRKYEDRITDLEKQVVRGRNIVHRLLVVIQKHKWWDYTVIDEARAYMSEVDRG